MIEPVIQVLGVYRLTVTADLIRRQDALFWGASVDDPNHKVASDDTEKQLRSIVLVELKVLNRDERFHVSDFTQRQELEPRENWQAAWAESFQSLDGTELIAVAPFRVPAGPDLRVAFFMHFWNPALPLETSYGPIVCPPPAAMPERLDKLVPYQLMD